MYIYFSVCNKAYTDAQDAYISNPIRRNINMKDKVILAYSGGLDTTAIIPWLKEKYKRG